MTKTRPTDITLLIYDDMDSTGGIQSIVVRTLKKMKESENLAYVVCNAHQPVDGVSRSDIIDIDMSPYEILKSATDTNKEIYGNLNIIAFAPKFGPLAYIIQRIANRYCRHLRPRISLCVLHPRDLMREQDRKHVHIMNKLMAFAIDTRNISFMNVQCRLSHEIFLGRDLTHSPIVPVPIDQRNSIKPKFWGIEPIKVISVGRIVPFKAYNFILPGIISNLTSRGITIEYDIYGHGTHEAFLLRTIENNDCKDFVRFLGPMKLEIFDNIVSKYHLFIGMGTAAVQAAQLGIPTILAIDNDADGAHGFFYEVPFGNVGEADQSIPRRKLTEVIESFIAMSETERLEISILCSKAANRYVLADYVEKLTEQSVKRNGILGYLASGYCRFYLWMLKDNWIRNSIRIVKRKETKDIG